MVAISSSTNTQTQLHYELSQQKKDASDALRSIRVDKQGKPINLETWRKSLDIALNLIQGKHYLHPNHNISLVDSNSIAAAQADMQLVQVTKGINMIDNTQSSSARSLPMVKEESQDEMGDDDESPNIVSRMFTSTPSKKIEKRVSEDERKETTKADTLNFMRKILEKNMRECDEDVMVDYYRDEDSVFYLDTTLAVPSYQEKEVMSHFKRIGVNRLYTFEKDVKLPDGEIKTQVWCCPLEDSFKRRKRTIIFNMIKESVKEVKEYLWAHVVFGDIEGLVNWFMLTYGIDRRADREKRHYKLFNKLASAYEINNFDNWMAKVESYLAEDKILKMNTPPAFIRYKMNDAVDNHGNEDLKNAWYACENELIRKRFKEKKKTTFDQDDLMEFLMCVKIRYSTYFSQNQKRQNKPNKQETRVRRTRNNDKQTDSSTDSSSTNKGKKNDRPCVYHNMIEGCKNEKCRFSHHVIEDEKERRRMIDVISKSQRCNVCGLTNHETKDCKKEEEMKKILEKRKRKKVRLTTNEKQEESKEGQPNKGDDEDE